MAEQWDEKAVFLAALELEPSDRNAFLRGACPDPEQRARVEKLLQHHATATDRFLEPADAARADQSSTPAQVDEFRIIQRLGEGGMGVVYLAEDMVLGRRVALKILAGHLAGSRDALARFVEEARSAAVLKHRAIVPVYKFGFDGQHHYIASEFVDGPTLADLIHRERDARTGGARTRNMRMWHRRSAEIAEMIADALDASHRASILHRDVKPSNILIDQSGQARLADFGIAKQLGEETAPTVMIGSCHYMSPEQASIAATRIDQRSDIFSLGVVMYEMLALRRPFEGSDVSQVLRAVVSQDPARLRTVDRTIPRDLETIAHKALEKKPEHRYQTAAHMAADLRCLLENRPILARPPSPWRRAGHWMRVHRKATISASFLALIVVIAVLMVRAKSIDQQRWRDARSAIVFDLAGAEAEVFYRAIDPMLGPVGKGQRLGQVSDGAHWVLPGHYRFELIAADGAFAELDWYVESASASGVTISNIRLTTQPDPAAGMVLVPAGTYRIGREAGDALDTRRDVHVGAFYIDKHEVTNAEYKAFIDATGREMPCYWGDTYDAALDDLPVAAISWSDMQAYARWAGKRLPTAIEWEIAARHPDGRLLPWAGVDVERPARASREEATVIASVDCVRSATVYRKYARPVNEDSLPASALELTHLFGNVSEGTATLDFDRGHTAVVKGIGFADNPEPWDLTRYITIMRGADAESGSANAGKYIDVGFRCARSAAPTAGITK